MKEQLKKQLFVQDMKDMQLIIAMALADEQKKVEAASGGKEYDPTVKEQEATARFTRIWDAVKDNENYFKELLEETISKEEENIKAYKQVSDRSSEVVAELKKSLPKAKK